MLPIVHPTIGAMFKIPTRLLIEAGSSLDELRRQLTVDHYNAETQETTPVKLYKMIKGGIAVPRSFGRDKFPALWKRARDKTKKPQRDPSLFKHSIKSRNPEQAKFFVELAQAVASDNVSETQVKAATGSGKTIAFLFANAYLGNFPILVIVDTNHLKEQWLGSIKEKNGLRFMFGEEWVKKNVGIVQQNTCNYRGKKVVIAMAPTLVRRRYKPEFYRYFGIVGVDEVHKMATPTGNAVLGMFSAAHVVCLTATPKKGVMGKVVRSYCGDPAIVSGQKVMKPIVTRVRFRKQVKWVHWKTGRPLDDKRLLITKLSKDMDRQALLADIIYYRGWKRGRHVLGLSDRTAQLTILKKRLIELGVPADTIGIFAGKYDTDLWKVTGTLSGWRKSNRETKDKRGVRVTMTLNGYEPFPTRPDANLFVNRQVKHFAKLHGLKTSEIENNVNVAPYVHDPKPEEYAHIKEHCQIVLATYGAFADGQDISRLTFGIELSPRGNVEQAVGRVLRLKEGKDIPEWYSIFDDLRMKIERSDGFGREIVINYTFKTPIRLEQQRRKSYDNQEAIRKKMDRPHEALQSQKAQDNEQE